jgi:hypothetical protein
MLPTPMEIQAGSVAESCPGGRHTLIVDLPAERALADTSLIDRIIDTVFDDLDRTTVEVRVRTPQRIGTMV